MKVVPLLEDGVVLDVLCSFFTSGIQETLDTSSLVLESQKFVGIDSFRTDEATISLSNTYQNGSIVCEKLGSPVTDITVALNDELFSFKSCLKTQFAQLLRVRQNLPGSIVDAQTSGLLSTSDTVMVDFFASGDTCVVDVSVAIEDLILILDDGHFSTSSADIWSRNIDCSSQSCLFAQSSGVVAGNSFDFVL